jgi:hypothetical protein
MIMSNVTPIDTEYNGYKFRSRLEARWAIFFDQIGMRYLYEPEGFELNGVRYLPDFQLPAGIQIQGEASLRRNVWVEIKPAGALKDEEREKVAAFVKQTDNQVILIAGDPGPDASIRFIHYSQNGNWFTPRVQFVELENGALGLAKREKGAAPAANGRTPALLAAYKAARQARFEHGAERPAEQIPTTKKMQEV